MTDIIPDSNKLIKILHQCYLSRTVKGLGFYLLEMNKLYSYLSWMFEEDMKPLGQRQKTLLPWHSKKQSISISVSLPSVPSPTKDDADRPQRNE